MDAIQILGDYVHLLGMVILLAKLWFTKNCAGISGKTQLLYAMVFTARITDLTIRYVTLYNTILKIVHISIAYCTVLSIFLFFRKTYDRKRDAFRIELLILPCAVFALFLNKAFETIEVFCTFSVYLESVAIVPQVYLVSKSKQVESVVVSYISCLGLYQGCYLMHWLYVYLKQMPDVKFEHIAVAGGIVQLIFYIDFFARNLPILKPERCSGDVNDPLDKEAAVGQTGAKDRRVGRQVVRMLEAEKQSEATAEDKSERGNATEESEENARTTEERVTLLVAKEQGTSN